MLFVLVLLILVWIEGLLVLCLIPEDLWVSDALVATGVTTCVS